MACEVWRDGGERGAALAKSGGGKQPAQTSGGRSGGADSNPEGGELKEVVSPSSKRREVKLAIEAGVGTPTQACRALGLARSSYYRNSTMNVQSRSFQKQIVGLSRDHRVTGIGG